MRESASSGEAAMPGEPDKSPIELDDDSIITPDIDRSAIEPPPDAAVPVPDLKKLTGEPPDVRTIAIVGLLLLAALYTLHFARAFFLPIVLAILMDFLLSPLVRGLQKLRVPVPLGAAIVMLGLVAVVGVTAYTLSGPAAEWASRAPASFDLIQDKLQMLRGPVVQVSDAAERVEAATNVGGGDEVQVVQIKGPSLVSQLFGGTTTFLGVLVVVVFLTYFLLAVGDLFLQKLVTVLPQFRDKKKAVAIARETEAQISAYLFTATLINIGVGVVTAGAMYLVGMPNPMLWGAVAALLNFVPYIGAFVNMAILALAAVLTFDNIGQALLVPTVFLGINIVEGNLLTPMILGRRMQMNTVALFIGLLFWWYLWGIPGAIMAVPMTVTLKIFCDHIEALAPVGEFLGD